MYKRASWDFGDALAGVSLEVTERKIAAGRCVNHDTAELIKHRRYVDNLIDSFRSAAEYFVQIIVTRVICSHFQCTA